MNGITDEPQLQIIFRSVKSKSDAAPDASIESRTKSVDLPHEKFARSFERNNKKRSGKLSADSSTACDEIEVFVSAEKVAESCARNSTYKFASLNSTTVVSTVTTPISSNLSNVVFLNPVTKIVTKGDALKRSKLYFLNGNVLKEMNAIEKMKADDMNSVCVANKLCKAIKKRKCENVVKNGKPVLLCSTRNGDTDSKKTELLSTIPISARSSYRTVKGNNPKIAFTVSSTIVTKPSGGNYELRHSKMNNTSASSSVSVSSQSPFTITVAGQPSNGGEKSNSTSSSRKEQESDSPAVAKARGELVRCRKALIEAAIHPQLPTYCPPTTYSGPTYGCEECEDTFPSLEGLSSHKNRRSVLFTYACPICKKMLEFYNRCMFLLHVRSHDIAVKACFLTISIIPANKLNFPVLDNELHFSKVDTSSSLELNSCNNCSDQASSAAGETFGVTSRSSRGTHILKKRKASSILKKNADENSQVADEEHFFDDNSEMGELSPAELAVLSSDDATAADSSNLSSRKGVTRANPSNNNVALASIRKAKLKRKRLHTSPLMKPTFLKMANIDDRSTSVTTNSRSTMSSSMIRIKTVENKSSVDIFRGNVKMAQTQVLDNGGVTPALKSPYETAEGGTSFDEVHLTISDEEDIVLQDEEQDQLVACRECKKDVPNLKSHYCATTQPTKEFPCEQCKFYNPSACARAAHMRMHTRSIPFICPDCGIYFRTIDSFFIHVKQVCFYDFKTIRFKCPECLVLKPSVLQFFDHLKRYHMREVFRCGICITSSYLSHVVQTHMERVHPGAPKSILEGYRCLLCPNVLVAKQSINVHIKKHVFGLQHLRYVYICKFCQKYASGRRSRFEEHYTSCPSRNLYSPSASECVAKMARKAFASGALSASCMSHEERAAQSQKMAVVVDTVVEKDPLSIEEWEADKLKAEYMPKTKWCIMCRTSKLNENSKSLFCNTCVSYVNADGSNRNGVSAVDSGISAENQFKLMDSATGRSKRKLKCKLCKELLNRDWSTITNHYLQNHQASFDMGVSKWKKQINPAAGSRGGCHNITPSRKRKKRQEQTVTTPTTSSAAGGGTARNDGVDAIVNADSSINTPDIRRSIPAGYSSLTSGAPPKKMPRGKRKYRRVKRGLVANEQNDFRECIVSHELQPNTSHQCEKCGECFGTSSSLEKHLFVVHNVCDLNDYCKKNDIRDGGSGDDADDESKEVKRKSLAKTRCEVCHVECNTQQQYDRHIRTHGTAFVAMQSRIRN